MMVKKSCSLILSSSNAYSRYLKYTIHYYHSLTVLAVYFNMYLTKLFKISKQSLFSTPYTTYHFIYLSSLVVCSNIQPLYITIKLYSILMNSELTKLQKFLYKELLDIYIILRCDFFIYFE